MNVKYLGSVDAVFPIDLSLVLAWSERLATPNRFRVVFWQKKEVGIEPNTQTTTFADSVEARHYDNDQPAGQVAKATTVQVATLAQLKPTQKPKVYKGQANEQTQMDTQSEIELLKQQLAELSKRI
jgi:hypothetical protein